MSNTTNRVIKTLGVIQERVKALKWTPEQEAEKSKALDFDFALYVRLQEAKSLAVANGRLTLEEGQTIYEWLGEGGPDKINGMSYAHKVVCTKLLQELLS